jgi:hypothetical protein
MADLALWCSGQVKLAFPLHRAMPYHVIDRVAFALHAQYPTPL